MKGSVIVPNIIVIIFDLRPKHNSTTSTVILLSYITLIKNNTGVSDNR